MAHPPKTVTYSAAVTFVSAVIDLRTGGRRQPWEYWELGNKIWFEKVFLLLPLLKTNLKLDLTTPLTAPPWVYLAQTFHSACIGWKVIPSSQTEWSVFCSSENTLSSFFRTAGGDLISTENCKENMRRGIWKEHWKGAEKSPSEGHIQRLWRSPFPCGCHHYCKRNSTKILFVPWSIVIPSAPAVVDCPSSKLRLL